MSQVRRKADITGDDNVNIDDLRAMAAAWLLTSDDPGFEDHENADLNYDGRINNTNSDILAANWLTDGLDCEEHYYYYYDGLGSVVAISDEEGRIKERYEYDVYGDARIYDHSYIPREVSLYNNPYLFTGRRYDHETGLYYYRARYYDPHIGRFTSRDPVAGKFEEPLTLHRYLYCRNDPINRIDPHGLWAVYMTGSAMLSMGFSVIGQAGIVIDDDGNVGFITISGKGVGTPQETVGVSFGWSPVADTIYDLGGPGWTSGGSLYPILPIPVAFEGFIGDNNIWGYEVTIGPSLFPIPEGHVLRTHTAVEATGLNWREGLEKMQGTWGEAMYEVRTWGEAYMWFMVFDLLDSL